MTRGQADYGLYAVREVSASISDMGEVAARLGSIAIYDKRGDVVEFDNFENPVLIWRSACWLGGSFVLDTTNSRSGVQSLKMTAGAPVGSSAGVARRCSLLAWQRVGIEASFSFLNPNCDIRLRIYERFTGGNKEAMVKYNGLTREISLWENGAYGDPILTIGPLAMEYYGWHNVKLVVDFVNSKYVRLMFAGHEYDISAYKIQVVPGELISNDVDAVINTITRVLPGGDCWFDDFILTQNEP